jgi:hypothetical protein
MGYPCRFIPRNVFDLATLTTTIAPLFSHAGRQPEEPAARRIVAGLRIRGRSRSRARGTARVGAWAVSRSTASTSSPRPRCACAASPMPTGRAPSWSTPATVAPYNAAALGSFTWGSIRSARRSSTAISATLLVFWLHAQTIQSFQIDIIGRDQLRRLVDVSRVVLGDSFETTYNAKFGARAGWKEPTEQDEAKVARSSAMRACHAAAMSGTLGNITPTERATVYNLLRFNGKRKAFPRDVPGRRGRVASSATSRSRRRSSRTCRRLAGRTRGNHEMPFTLVEA